MKLLKSFLVSLIIVSLVGCTEKEEKASVEIVLSDSNIESLMDGSLVKVSDENKLYFEQMQKVLDYVVSNHDGDEYNLNIGVSKMSDNHEDDIYYVRYDINENDEGLFVENYLNEDCEFLCEPTTPARYTEGFEPLLSSFEGRVSWQQAAQIALNDRELAMKDVNFIIVKMASINQLYEITYGKDDNYMYSIDNVDGFIQVRGYNNPMCN